MPLETAPVARAKMLIRRPAAEVYEAFVDPAVTTKFWFTRSSGRLEAGRDVRWEWEMYGVSTQVHVQELERDRRILIEWSGYTEPCPVEWRFTPRADGTTMVLISNWGFVGSDDEVVQQALDSTGGFHLVLAGLKAMLEHGVALNLVADHDPDAHAEPGE